MQIAAKNKSGFTLVEVLVASALLIFAMVPILKALAQINMNTVIIERRTKSLNLAKSQINQIQAKSVYNFDDNFTQNNLSLDNLYLCNISSSSVNTNLKAITVSVGMDRNQNGTLGSDEVEVSLKTQIARR
jgi:prepilin-type N-terminal cleavage/methylation domain-containing protein